MQSSRSSYRVYLVGATLAVDDVQPIAASDDASALSAAEQLLRSNPTAKGFTLVGPNARIIATQRR